MNIYVGNLSYKVEENELRQVFEEYGEVASVKIIADKYSGRSKGFAFIEMNDEKKAKKAIEELNQKEIDGRQIIVNVARPRRTEDNRE